MREHCHIPCLSDASPDDDYHLFLVAPNRTGSRWLGAKSEVETEVVGDGLLVFRGRCLVGAKFAGLRLVKVL